VSLMGIDSVNDRDDGIVLLDVLLLVGMAEGS
jgi:hypothetical protein